MNSPTATPAIVLFSTAEWFYPYWTNKQHIATRLGARGFNVLYVESIGFRQPGFNKNDLARIWRRIRRAASPVQKVQKNVSVLAPLTVPGSQHRSWAEQINTWQLRSRIELWLRRIGLSRPIVWTYHPYMLR